MAQTQLSKGISLQDMQAQLEAMKAQIAAKDAALAEATSTKPTERKLNPVAPSKPAEPKVNPRTPQGQLIRPATAPKSKSSSKQICGAKSPNGPCQKCNGPFNPILHFTLDALLALDGEGVVTVANQENRKYLGISVDDKYWGNVCIVGFGRDTLNMRPKTFLAMGHALGAFKASAHVTQVLPPDMLKDEE